MLLDENLEDRKSEIILSDKEIFTKIFTSPRMVFRYLENKNYDKFVRPLLILGGISNALDRAVSKNLGDSLSLFAILGIAIVAGALLGWISYYLYSALISWTGKWLNGKADTDSIVRMFAHAMIPTILAFLLLIPQLAFFGKGIFQSYFDIHSQGTLYTAIYFGTVFLEVALGVWTMVIFTIGVSEIQEFSILKAIANIILPLIIILVPIFLVIFATSGF